LNSQPDILCKTLRLFLSVDIAGSTAYKSRQPDKVQPWLPALHRFFTEFPISLAGHYTNGDTPVLWKTLGDEMVFVTRIIDHRQVASHLTRFRDTIAAYREVIKEADRKLDLKGAAWLAGFPVGNTMLKLRHGMDGAPELEDYVGPSIDNGFRLSKHATPRKFVLSVEAALMLTGTAQAAAVKPKVFLERGEELKGVLGGRPYPKLWIEVPYRGSEEFHKLEEELIDPPSKHDGDKIFDYCTLFIKEYGSPLFQPFIEGDTDFGVLPDGYDKQYDEVRQLWAEQIGQRLKQEPTAASSKLSAPEIEKRIAALLKKRPSEKSKENKPSTKTSKKVKTR
jgi:hypothetical protein